MSTGVNYNPGSQDYVPSHLHFVDLDAALLLKFIVCLLSVVLVLCSLRRRRQSDGVREDEDYDEFDEDLLKEIIADTYTFYSDCMYLTDLLEEVDIFSVDNAPDYNSWVNLSNTESSEVFTVSRNKQIYHPNSSKDEYKHQKELHVILPHDCKQCRSMHLCSNNGGKCLNVQIEVSQSGEDTFSESEESSSEWSGSCGSVNSLHSICSLHSSSASLPPLESESEQLVATNRACPVTSPGKPVSTDGRECEDAKTGISNLNLAVARLRQSVGVGVRKSLVRECWRLAILFVKIMCRLLPERLKQQMIMSPKHACSAENPPTAVDGLLGWSHVSSSGSDFKAKRAFFETRMPDLLKQRYTGPGSKIPIAKIHGPVQSQNKKARRSAAKERSDFAQRSFLLKMLGDEATNLLEMNLRHRTLQHLKGLPTLYTESLEKTGARVLARSPSADVDFTSADTPFMSKEIRGALEMHIKKRLVKRRWKLLRLALQSVRAFSSKLPKSRDTRQPRSHINSQKLKNETYLSSVSCQSTEDECSRPSVTDKTSVPLQGTVTHGTVEEITPNVKDVDNVNERSNGLEIKLAKMADGSCKGKSSHNKNPLRERIEPGARTPLSRGKNVPFMHEDAVSLIEMNLKRKRLEHQLGLFTIYTQSLELMKPKVAERPKSAALKKTELHLKGAKLSFLSKEIRENLESHIKRKKMQHLWGLPLTVQRSVAAFMPKAPGVNQSGGSSGLSYDSQAIVPDLQGSTDVRKEDLKREVKKMKLRENHEFQRTFKAPEAVSDGRPKPKHLSLIKPHSSSTVDTTDHESPAQSSSEKSLQIEKSHMPNKQE